MTNIHAEVNAKAKLYREYFSKIEIHYLLHNDVNGSESIYLPYGPSYGYDGHLLITNMERVIPDDIIIAYKIYGITLLTTNFNLPFAYSEKSKRGQYLPYDSSSNYSCLCKRHLLQSTKRDANLTHPNICIIDQGFRDKEWRWLNLPSRNQFKFSFEALFERRHND